ncbi:flagellar basal body-associated FliL family protein [Herminiimonas fonticola]|uniref:Flagellar protein FliL n=1 Tax=Herminiimonas fonticola TaxID=303380 RepID=A0A4R6G793_9BURK|nr:flagellar basal body-associated FliL family protein [Herminiimonas fonticola]RBA23850.1 Flagellar basal body-associated protein FliL [Herminiimonas fonticola]TDN89850.1 flagellar basal body-associated protein FliL [Herminiimonas fonticola]
MAKASVKTKTRQIDTNVIIIGGALAIVLVGMLSVWLYFSYGARPVSPSTYTSFGPVVVRSSEFAIKATIAVQTRNEDATWLASNKKQLDFALQAALANVDLKRLREPEGLTYVQTILRDAGNTALNTRNIEAVLLTDFIVQAQ